MKGKKSRNVWLRCGQDLTDFGKTISFCSCVQSQLGAFAFNLSILLKNNSMFKPASLSVIHTEFSQGCLL